MDYLLLFSQLQQEDLLHDMYGKIQNSNLSELQVTSSGKGLNEKGNSHIGVAIKTRTYP
jgi:hypothetical protein